MGLKIVLYNNLMSPMVISIVAMAIPVTAQIIEDKNEEERKKKKNDRKKN